MVISVLSIVYDTMWKKYGFLDLSYDISKLFLTVQIFCRLSLFVEHPRQHTRVIKNNFRASMQCR